MLQINKQIKKINDQEENVCLSTDHHHYVFTILFLPPLHRVLAEAAAGAGVPGGAGGVHQR